MIRSRLYRRSGLPWVIAALGPLWIGAVSLAAPPRSSFSRVSNRNETPGLAALPRPSTLAPDKGRFRIMAGGQQVGREDFEISQSGGNWVARGTSEVKTAQAVTHVTGTLELHADGTPAHYDWSTQGTKKASASIGFNGTTAMIELRVEGARPFTQQFTFNSPQIAVLDNNLYHQYAVLARLYNWSKRGPQTFSVLIPQELMPGTVTAESTGSATLDGKSYEGFRVTTSDLEVDLYLDSAHRLMRLEVPAAKVSVIRD
jgi:hypothetical protein